MLHISSPSFKIWLNGCGWIVLWMNCTIVYLQERNTAYCFVLLGSIVYSNIPQDFLLVLLLTCFSYFLKYNVISLLYRFAYTVHRHNYLKIGSSGKSKLSKNISLCVLRHSFFSFFLLLYSTPCCSTFWYAQRLVSLQTSTIDNISLDTWHFFSIYQVKHIKLILILTKYLSGFWDH